MPSDRPDIQRLLRRHVEGSDADKQTIVNALATSTVAMEQAEQAALRGHGLLATGDVAGARRALADADHWYDEHQKQIALLLDISKPVTSVDTSAKKKHFKKGHKFVK